MALLLSKSGQKKVDPSLILYNHGTSSISAGADAPRAERFGGEGSFYRGTCCEIERVCFSKTGIERNQRNHEETNEL